MEILLQNLPCCENIEQEQLINTVKISIVSETNKAEAYNFLLNNDLEHSNISLDAAIVCTNIVDNNSYIVGLFCFEQNHPNTKVSVDGECDIPRKFYELTYVFIDKNLWRNDFLAKLFSIVFFLFIQKDTMEYVFWGLYRGQFCSKIVNQISNDQYNYYCQNEGGLFAKELLQIYDADIKYKEDFENRLRNLLNK